ncbi:MAG TPA: hypothetical protein VFH94_05525 [Streptomyces sp.]|nr:hypothetical protein [Pedococcus sp.]HET6856541.1 hypothetical protein [Streptomyces sp.]
MRSTLTIRIAAVATAAVALAGCGAGTALVGVHDAPSETTTTAPVAPDTAATIAARVLADAARARSATGEEAKDLRAKALTGPALTVSSADSRLAKAGSTSADPVTKPTTPKVLGISRGSAFPRVMLVQSTREDGALVLNLLVSAEAAAPFKLAASAPMQPGTSVAALDPLEAGSPLTSDGTGLAIAPEALLTEYAASLAYPKPAAAPHVQSGDRFADAVRTNARTQSSSLKSLATLTQKHNAQPKTAVAISLKDGGAVVFGLMERVDTVALKPSGKSLTPSADFQRLLGKKTLTKRAEMRTYETVVFTVPPKGKATLVAVDETLVSAKGE